SFDDPFEDAELAAGENRQPGGLLGQLVAGSREIDVGDLEQLGIELAVRLVVPADREQSGHEALPQSGFPLPAGVVDPEGGDGGAGLERGSQPLFDQAEGDGLVEAGPGQVIANGRLNPLALPARGTDQGDGPVLRDVVVAVDPRDLLDQV